MSQQFQQPAGEPARIEAQRTQGGQPMQGGQQGQAMQPGMQATGTQSGMQATETQAGMQATGMRLSQVETPQQRQALQDVTEALKACAWCADQCIQEADPDMIECIRLCEDVTELAATALELVPRRSRQATTILRALEQAMQACAQECRRHQAGHCQECGEVLQQASQSVQQLEQSLVQ